MNQITNSACYLLDLLVFFNLVSFLKTIHIIIVPLLCFSPFPKIMLNLNVVSRDLKLSASLTV